MPNQIPVTRAPRDPVCQRSGMQSKTNLFPAREPEGPLPWSLPGPGFDSNGYLGADGEKAEAALPDRSRRLCRRRSRGLTKEEVESRSLYAVERQSQNGHSG